MDDSPKVVFNSLDRNADIEFSQRNLPHWFQVGAAMFITFRTADSLPREVLLRMKRELEAWLAVRRSLSTYRITLQATLSKPICRSMNTYCGNAIESRSIVLKRSFTIGCDVLIFSDSFKRLRTIAPLSIRQVGNPACARKGFTFPRRLAAWVCDFFSHSSTLS